MGFTFIHAADIHLDSPLKGLEKYEGAPLEQIRTAPRKAFVNLIDVAIERKVDFLVLAGDIYDGDWRDFNTGLFFAQQMNRLHQHGISVYLIKGNHDAASKMTRNLKLPPNVKEFSVKKAETYIIEELQVALHGQGFASREVMDNLALLYPNRVQGHFNIGVLHTSGTGSADSEHDTYAPCTITDMKSKEYDYWALGHIHKREFLSEMDPVILFPGNIQGRHIKESGDKGCTFVQVEDGKIVEMEHISLDVLRWALCEIDVSYTEEFDDVYEQVRDSLRTIYLENEQKMLVVRVVLQGATDLCGALLTAQDEVINNIRSISYEIAPEEIWIEKVKIHTKPLIDLKELKKGNTPESAVLHYIDSVSDELMKELVQEFQDLNRQLPLELKEKLGISTSQVTERLEDVENVIVHHLQKGGK